MGAILIELVAVAFGAPVLVPPEPGRVEPAGGAAVGQLAAPPERVGRVIVVGNTRTGDVAILRELPDLTPGGLLPSEADLLRGEIRLLVKYHRRFDLDAEKRPKVEVLPAADGSVLRDVRVSFPELIDR